jgi:hypothetical protein
MNMARRTSRRDFAAEDDMDTKAGKKRKIPYKPTVIYVQ